MCFFWGWFHYVQWWGCEIPAEVCCKTRAGRVSWFGSWYVQPANEFPLSWLMLECPHSFLSVFAHSRFPLIMRGFSCFLDSYIPYLVLLILLRFARHVVGDISNCSFSPLVLWVLQNVGWLITEMQKKIFESQGVQGKYGVFFLGRIGSIYGNDEQIMSTLMRFVDRWACSQYSLLFQSGASLAHSKWFHLLQFLRISQLAEKKWPLMKQNCQQISSSENWTWRIGQHNRLVRCFSIHAFMFVVYYACQLLVPSL